jgi:hypothetical protein
MTEEFDILEKGSDYLVAEAGDETYIVEDAGFDEDTGTYFMEVGDSDTVYSENNDFTSPNTVRILESEVEEIEGYEDVAEKALEKIGAIEETEEQGAFGLNRF